MKKWHKIVIIILVIAAAIAVSLFCIYEFYGKNKIEETLQKAQVILQDEELQEEVELFVEEMVQSGELEASQLEGYASYMEAKASETPKSEVKPKTLMERVKEAMTAEEFSFAVAMYSKLDVSYILSNINRDKQAVKDYIKSTLTSDELSKTLEIYGKYSYLLN